ncbi:phospholipid carrier-dependent glycosyltransferase [Heliobacillus mobilis]|uniref:Phospholipid carrier-dependent glycosyltransferase n=1 Tax=Heliobacterium mobile TaxID=28064 RepID=A0A6I3SIK9_HELMO|nr:glycosyltransferase family 39 protein [Heliobacterium mobile]MTV48698.1 phospholipid carrier-dependent glycosyltransferase [Heliobacterium mobile]
MDKDRSSENGHKMILGAILFLALVLRFGVVYVQGPELLLNSDDRWYVQSAANWLTTGTMTFCSDSPSAFIGPVYPAFLAVIFSAFGSDDQGLQAVRYGQAFLGVLIVLLTYLLARRVTEPRTALLAAFLMSFYPPNILINGLFLTETLFTFFNLAYMLLLVKLSHEDQLSEKGETFLFGLLGAFTALLALTRATSALYPAVFMVYLLWRRKLPLQRWFRNGLVLCMAFCIFMSPWWIRNYVQFDRFIPFSTGAGDPLLLGTYVDMEGIVDGVGPDWPTGNGELDLQEKYKQYAIERLKENVPKEPWRYLKWYTVGKFLLMWGGPFMWPSIWDNLRPWVDYYHQYLMIFAFGGAALALWRWWNRRKDLEGIGGGLQHDQVPRDRWGAGGQFLGPLLLLSIPVYYSILHNLYFGFGRYNIPFMPLVLLFVSYFIVEVYDVLMGVRKGDYAKGILR